MTARLLSDARGWALLESMAILLILTVLVAVSAGSYAFSVAHARAVACESAVRQLNLAVTAFHDRHGGLPRTLSDLVPYIPSNSATCCPSDGRPYVYDPLTGQVTCSNHPSQ
jgi:Tfp pilus assembly protein PilE